MASTEDPKGLFEEVKRFLSRNGMASLSELERSIGKLKRRSLAYRATG